MRETYLGYELSPNPNSTKFTPFRKSGGSLLRRRDFQNVLALAGKSPWPVVETTKKVNV